VLLQGELDHLGGSAQGVLLLLVPAHHAIDEARARLAVLLPGSQIEVKGYVADAA
jgi:hypothetical protein